MGVVAGAHFARKPRMFFQTFLLLSVLNHRVITSGGDETVEVNKRAFHKELLRATETNCHAPLGLQDSQKRTAFALSATEGDVSAAPLHGRTSWMAGTDAALYIDLGSNYIVTGVQTQGDPHSEKWVTSYLIGYADSCDSPMFTYNTNEEGELKIFHGNRDQNTVVTNLIDDVFEARCVELTITKYHGTSGALRLELLGCEKGDCTSATLGLDNRMKYRRSHFTSDSRPLSFRHLPSSARPSGQGWIPKDPHGSWLQVQLPAEKILHGVVISGDKRGQRWVTKYQVSVSRNCMEDIYVMDAEREEIQIFDGPINGGEKKKQMFPYPTRASCIRIHPLQFSPGGAAIRVDLIGCGTGNGISGGCGRQKLSPIRQKRIVGGDISAQGQWPWLASMREFGRLSVCGAAIINNQWLVTAAHCVVRRTKGLDMSEGDNWTVRLGEHYVEQEEGTSFDADVEVIIPHPDYVSATKANDIALVKITSSIQFTDYINRVCLPEAGDQIDPGDKCYVGGWGMLDYDMAGFAQVLHHVPINVITNAECEAKYKSVRFNVTSDMLCAGANSGGRDACQGDSGGPLSCHKNGVWLAAGVVSFGQGCGSDRYPGVYTRMTSYLDWMDTVIASN